MGVLKATNGPDIVTPDDLGLLPQFILYPPLHKLQLEESNIDHLWQQ